jgi:hypothetical protein
MYTTALIPRAASAKRVYFGSSLSLGVVEGCNLRKPDMLWQITARSSNMTSNVLRSKPTEIRVREVGIHRAPVEEQKSPHSSS